MVNDPPVIFIPQMQRPVTPVINFNYRQETLKNILIKHLDLNGIPEKHVEALYIRIFFLYDVHVIKSVLFNKCLYYYNEYIFLKVVYL